MSPKDTPGRRDDTAEDDARRARIRRHVHDLVTRLADQIRAAQKGAAKD